jgi:hypothetical protein
MKKFLCLVLLSFELCSTVWAEVYHGIDIDAVYEQSDWNSTAEIKQIIDDYTLVLEYQTRLAECSKLTEPFACFNMLAKNIIIKFYVGSRDEHLKEYQTYIRATSSAYGIVYCLNKYKVPATICRQDNIANTRQFAEQYIRDMLHTTAHHIEEHDFIQNYKK